MSVDKKKQKEIGNNNIIGKRLVLLDSHAILHRAYHALPDFSTSKGEPTGALYGLSAMIIKIIEDLRPDYLVACYDVKGPTLRHDVYEAYKAGRKKAEDDLISQINRSRDIFMAMGVPIYDKQGFEADDILGTIVKQVEEMSPLSADGQAKDQGNGVSEVVIASGDMDTLQLVSGEKVKVYTLKKGIKDTVIYDESAVRERYGFGPELIPDYKGLRGDPSDNIPGVKGVGEKTATALIQEFGRIEEMHKELDSGNEARFKKAGITPRIITLLKDNKEEAVFSKMLATIRCDAPIRFLLPDKTFTESLDLQKIAALWHELEFRTLKQRLEKVVGVTVSADTSPSSDTESGLPCLPAGRLAGSSFSAAFASSERSASDDVSANTIPVEDLFQTTIALWLVNSNLTNPTLEDVLDFASTKDYGAAKKAIFDELEKKGLRKVFDTIEIPLSPVVARMDGRGIKIDRQILARLSKEYHAELSRLEGEIWRYAGMEFNINSPKQLGEVLFTKMGLKAKNQKKTAGGSLSTRESELEKLRDAHPVVSLILEYRELAKLLSTYIDAIPPMLDENDRLHTHFLQTGTTTGRMSSQSPNLQNIPIKSELGRAIRQAFVAEKGYKLAAFDYSQIELRIAAFLSGDEKLIDIFKKGEDVHSSVASFVFGVPLSGVTSDMRRQAKVINFGIMYGMGVLALKQNLGTSREEAQKFLNDYFNTFSGLATYLDKVKAETARKGYTETFFGRRRYFEGITSKIPYVRAQAERMAINAPIQGTEADIIKLALIRVDEYLGDSGLRDKVFPLLQVHDELVYEIAEDVVDQVAPRIAKIMQEIMSLEDTKGIPLTANYHVGENWGGLK